MEPGKQKRDVPVRSFSVGVEARGLYGLRAQPLSPLEYRFLMRRASAVSEELIEDAILAIGSVSTALSFQDAVLNALHMVLSNVKQSLVFLLNTDSQELEWTSESCPLSKSGVLWEAVRSRSASILKSGEVIQATDPMRELFPDFKCIEQGQVLLINPIVEEKQYGVIALMVALCDEPSAAQIGKLRWVEKNVLVAASRVLKQVSIERDCSRSVGMLNVCSELIDLDTTSLSIKILKHIKHTLDVKMCALFLVSEVTRELVCSAQNEVPLEKEITIEVNPQNIYGRCFLNREALILDDVSKDVRFNPAVDKINNYDPSSMMCLPICVQKEEDSIQQTVGVAVVCDKADGNRFTSRDKVNMAFVLRFSSSVIANTLAYQRELTLKKQNQALLLVAKNLFSQLSDLTVLLKEIMSEARNITNAERCSLFLLDPVHQDLVAAVFDGALATQSDAIRIKVGQGIAGLVAQSGKLVNIKDAYQHPQFFSKMDQNTGFHTRNLLCFPIKDHKGIVVGVAQLCNKIGANFFSLYDEELATTFSVYCGISLYQSQLYKKMEESQRRSQLATELMIYHMQVFSEDVEQLAASPIPPCSSFNEKFITFSYSPRSLPEADTFTAVMSMMTEMDLINQWKIERNTLARFLLMVKKGYRDVPYHSWFHALSVSHFCYVLYCHCDRFSFLSEVEILALFVACLCHDIDHRGTNNAFQVSSNSTLASLYSSEGSVMERHHFAQTVCILNSKGCNIFDNLPHDHYRKVLDLVQYNILSTDITHHLHLRKGFEELAAVGYQKSNQEHHKKMCSLVMTSCDVCNACKEWEWAKRISDLVYTEFFTQGDLEKALGNTPIEMMDRNKAFVPDQQLGFIHGIVGPAYKFLAQLLPGAAPAYENIEKNRKIWEKLSKEGKQGSD